MHGTPLAGWLAGGYMSVVQGDYMPPGDPTDWGERRGHRDKHEGERRGGGSESRGEGSTNDGAWKGTRSATQGNENGANGEAGGLRSQSEDEQAEAARRVSSVSNHQTSNSEGKPTAAPPFGMQQASTNFGRRLAAIAQVCRTASHCC